MAWYRGARARLGPPRPFGKSLRLLVLGVALSAALACAAPPPAAPATVATPAARALPLPAGPVPGRPWAERACQTGRREPAVLACVNGVAITRQAFDRSRAAHADADPRAVLQALIDAELLAQAAHARGLWSPDLGKVQRRAMVAELLVATQERGLRSEDVPAADIQRAYKAMQPLYDRAASWFVTDVQLLCCHGDWRQCQQREEIRACIDKLESQARDLAKVLHDDLPVNGLELGARVATLGARFPTAAVAEVSFFYDPAKSYAEQKGYDVMVREFTDAVLALQPGQLGQPVRSPFGWHIPRLDRVEPARHEPWDAPAVRHDIATHIVDLVRERELQRLAFGLMERAGAKLYFERLEPAALAPQAVP